MVKVLKPFSFCVWAWGLLWASIWPYLTADKTENFTHLCLVSHSTMASVTKPTFGFHYSNVRPHPSTTIKVSGTSKPSSILLFTLSISEQGLDETRGKCVSCVCCISAASPNTLCVFCSSNSLFLLLWTFWCEIAFLVFQTAVGILIREKAQPILWGKWQRRWQPP